MRSVKLGASNDTSTDIVSGLSAGDMVVVTSTSSSSSSTNVGPQGGFVIGGPGGGETFTIGR